MEDLEKKAGELGSTLCDSIARKPARQSAGVRYATVVAVGGGAVSVDISGSLVESLPATTACAGAKPGDRCVVLVDGQLLTVIGILGRWGG